MLSLHLKFVLVFTPFTKTGSRMRSQINVGLVSILIGNFYTLIFIYELLVRIKKCTLIDENISCYFH